MVERKRKVTLDQIAVELGVSKFTVSRALSGKPGISEAMREQVFATARQLGYPLRSVAATNAPERTTPSQGMIVMLLPESSAIDTDFWPKVLMGAQVGARHRKTSLILAVVSAEEEATLRLPPHIEHIHIEGFLCSDRLTLSYISFVRQLGYPAVCIDTYFPDLALDGVMADDADGARAAVRHLIDQGHEKIGFIGNSQYASSFQKRWGGFRATLEEAELRVRREWCLLRKGNEDPWDPIWLREQLLALREMPTAWFCTNDLTAFALMKALSEMKLRVPEDVSVVGFDDVARAATEATPLTTVHFAMEVMGRRCVERLYQRIENPADPVDLTLISTRLVVRESVRPVKGRELPGSTKNAG